MRCIVVVVVVVYLPSSVPKHPPTAPLVLGRESEFAILLLFCVCMLLLCEQ